MKNKIIMIILLVSIVLVVCLAIFGFKIGGFEIPSVSKIIAKNDNVNSDIEQLSGLIETKYPGEITKLETTISSLDTQREKYEQLSGFSESSSSVYETEKYDIVYLWTTLGQYASKYKVNLSMDVKKSTGTDLYNLNFTVQGEYVDISTLITKLENDSDLSFRIYNFKLVPGASNVNLKATFTIRDVNIDSSTLISQSASQMNSNNQDMETNRGLDTTKSEFLNNISQ